MGLIPAAFAAGATAYFLRPAAPPEPAPEQVSAAGATAPGGARAGGAHAPSSGRVVESSARAGAPGTAGPGGETGLWAYPLQNIKNTVTSCYGVRKLPTEEAPRMHKGLDLRAREEVHVAAIGPGRITHAGPARGYGNLVLIQHLGGWESRYAHLSSVRVRKGQIVPKGHALGYVGMTGHTFGPHLHFEVKKHGRLVDPLPLLLCTGRPVQHDCGPVPPVCPKASTVQPVDP